MDFIEDQKKLILRMHTEIDETSIRFKNGFRGEHVINWTNVEHAEVLDYGFVGGFGTRLSLRYGTVYNIWGKMGLALKLKNGSKLLIGTQKPKEMKECVDLFFNTRTQLGDND